MRRTRSLVIGTRSELALIKSSLRLPALALACACDSSKKILEPSPGLAPGLALPVCQARFQVLRCRAYRRAKSVA